ncbi:MULTISPECIES: glucosaminidase domain-containing protein [Chitinophagaceae]
MRKLVLATIIIAASFTLKAQNTSVQDYIYQYKDIAITEMVRTGVPASITLAQGILESGSGNSKLAKYSNNHFGIKCKKEWTGETVYQDDDIRNECFRVYKSAEDSYRDHSDFLKNRPYYTSLFSLDPKDYKAWAQGLKKAGYATERDYPKNLIGLIEKYNLEQYSDEALARINKGETQQDDVAVANSSAASNNAATASQQSSDNNNLALFNDAGTPLEEKDKPGTGTLANSTRTETQNVNNYAISKSTCTLIANAYPTGIFKINRTKVIYLAKGTSLFALASTQRMSYNKLLDYNDLEAGTDILLKDRLVYLEKKPKKGEKSIHIVSTGESLDEVAQKEGIQLNSLAQYNHIGPSSIPLPGENLYLRTMAPGMPKLATTSNLAMLQYK